MSGGGGACAAPPRAARRPVAGMPRLPSPPRRLALIGGIALALGMLVYATDRDPAHALLFPALAALHVGPMFGAPGAWLPSFVHPLAFSLLSAAALPRRPRPAYGACAAWWMVNVAFEIAQHPKYSGAVAHAVHRAFGHGAVADALAGYGLHGRFDPADLIAATAGSLAAAALLRHFRLPKDCHAR